MIFRRDDQALEIHDLSEGAVHVTAYDGDSATSLAIDDASRLYDWLRVSLDLRPDLDADRLCAERTFFTTAAERPILAFGRMYGDGRVSLSGDGGPTDVLLDIPGDLVRLFASPRRLTGPSDREQGLDRLMLAPRQRVEQDVA